MKLRLLASLILFAPAALSQSPHLLLSGAHPGSQFGASVAGAGDVDGDGRVDLVVGAPFTNAGAGAMHVFSGLDGSLLLSVTGPSGSEFGSAVAGVGDLDGDGLDDVLVGMPFAGSGKGKVRAYSVATGATILSVAGAATGHVLGWSLDGLGDTNNDGVPDFVVGVPGDGLGSARIVSGLDGSTLHLLVGNSVNEQFGLAVACAGDVNGDGTSDVVVGAPDYGLDPGSVWVFSGLDGSTLHTFTGTKDHDFLGLSVAGGADVDGDGFDDIAYGGRGDGSGVAVVRSGATGALLMEHVGFEDHFGHDVDLADFDGDGHADLLVTSYATEDEGGGPNGGNLRVYSGLDDSVLFSVSELRPQSWFGWSASFVGDVDGDGLPDVAAGAPQKIPSGSGKVSVYRGRSELGVHYCSPGTPNSTGQPGHLRVQGSPVVSEGWVTLLATQLPPNKMGFFLVGASQTYLPNPGGSQGTLCVDGARVLLPQANESYEWGTLGVQLHLDALPGGGAIQAGETWYFQAWHLDSNPTKTSNLTDAVEVTFQ